MANKLKSVYICKSCGYENPKWYGKCPQCGEWDTMEEEIRKKEDMTPSGRTVRKEGTGRRALSYKMNEIKTDGEQRYHTGMTEFDRVLGGGLVKGSIVLDRKSVV